jgi:nucleoside-diphosphate-sugar epimerase
MRCTAINSELSRYFFMILHLAAEVGGIGANRDNPGRYFFANAAMGLHLIEGARKVGLKKFVQVGTICAYPKFTPVPFKESDLWSGYPEETNAPYGIAKKALLVMCQAYREQYGLNSRHACMPRLTTRKRHASMPAIIKGVGSGDCIHRSRAPARFARSKGCHTMRPKHYEHHHRATIGD